MKLNEVLENYKNGLVSQKDTLSILSEKGVEDMGFARIDTDRQNRTGIPEVIYAAGKTPEQVKNIAERMYKRGIDVLATRATKEMFSEVREIIPGATFNKSARTIVFHHNHKEEKAKSYIVVVAAGTSDMPVAEEAVETARFLGNKVESVFDVGVAGIHRLFQKIDIIRGAKVIIVVAGMEGALPSVIGGLVNKPVIAVPTSIGYGANLGGISAMLTMLNSCAAGISVVNIDNGFGAACQASLINNLK